MTIVLNYNILKHEKGSGPNDYSLLNYFEIWKVGLKTFL